MSKKGVSLPPPKPSSNSRPPPPPPSKGGKKKSTASFTVTEEETEEEKPSLKEIEYFSDALSTMLSAEYDDGKNSKKNFKVPKKSKVVSLPIIQQKSSKEDDEISLDGGAKTLNRPPSANKPPIIEIVEFNLIESLDKKTNEFTNELVRVFNTATFFIFSLKN